MLMVLFNSWVFYFHWVLISSAKSTYTILKGRTSLYTALYRTLICMIFTVGFTKVILTAAILKI